MRKQVYYKNFLILLSVSTVGCSALRTAGVGTPSPELKPLHWKFEHSGEDFDNYMLTHPDHDCTAPYALEGGDHDNIWCQHNGKEIEIKDNKISLSRKGIGYRGYHFMPEAYRNTEFNTNVYLLTLKKKF